MRLPSPLHKLWSGWKTVSRGIGIVMSSMLLTVLWVVAFGAYAVVFKIPGLFMKKTKPETFWRDISSEHHDFRDQF